MASSSRPLLCLLACCGAASGAIVAGCGADRPLGPKESDGPARVSTATTTAQLMSAAVSRSLPSVVAVSAVRGDSVITGTGTVLARGLVTTDATLVESRPTATPSPAPTPAPSPAGTTPAGTTPAGTTPAGTSPAGTTPESVGPTTPAAAPQAPSPRLEPVPSPPQVSVRDGSGNEHDATIQGVDRVSGLAVLRVDDLGDVPPARAGNMPALGQEIAGLGYLSARRPAVRPGVVVTLGRSSRRNRESEVGLLEATVPLGVQALGGPLVDGRGQVVALTTRALPAVVPGAVVGLPYASALRITKALSARGRVRRAYLGLDTVAITPTRAQELRLTTSAGVLIQTIVRGSPAAFSALRGPTGSTTVAGRPVPTGGDAITKIDGRPLRQPEDLDAFLATRRPGDRVALQVIRGERSLVVRISLGER